MAAIIRKNVEKYLRKFLTPIFQHPYMSDHFSYSTREKFITKGATAIDFILAIATFVVMIWFFQRLNNRLGFESTVITMLTIIAFLLRNFLEVNAVRSQEK
jgi:uncharacterized membrane protein YbaN (DUF454 family)